MVGRIIAVFGTFYLFSLCFRKKTISFKELIFISYGGMIRGAIAFALVLTIPHCTISGPCPGAYELEQYELAKSTTLIIVMATTLLFGTFMKAFQTWLLGGNDHHNERTETQLDVLERVHSVYEEITHPNLDITVDHGRQRKLSYLLPNGPQKGGFSDSKFASWFAEFDEKKLRPFLIRNYTMENVLL